MRATKAYIASLGTTGVLLGASILMLAVVSAVVAFDRWPSGNVSTRVQTLVLTDEPAPIRVSAAAAGRSATPFVRATSGPATPRAGNRATEVAGRQITGGRLGTPALPGTPLKAVPPATVPRGPGEDTATPIIDTISNPGGTAGQVADGAQSVTDAAGISLGKVNAQLGVTVAATGQSVAQVIRELPLPDHIIPGH